MTDVAGRVALVTGAATGIGRHLAGRLETAMAEIAAATGARSMGAKSALMRITESLAASTAGTGVTVFDLAPGIVDTAMYRSMPMWAGFTDWVPPERVVSFVAAIAAGEVDQWSGRLLSAMVDDLAELRSTTPADGDRQLRLRPFWDGDPFASC